MIFCRNRYRERNVWDDDDMDKKGCDRDEVLTHSMHSFISSAVSSGGRRAGRNSFVLKTPHNRYCAPRLLARLFSRRRKPTTEMAWPAEEEEYQVNNYLEVADGGQRKQSKKFKKRFECNDEGSPEGSRRSGKLKKKRTSRLRKTAKFNGSDNGGMSAAAKMYLCHRDSTRDSPIAQRTDLHLFLSGGVEDGPITNEPEESPEMGVTAEYENEKGNFDVDQIHYDPPLNFDSEDEGDLKPQDRLLESNTFSAPEEHNDENHSRPVITISESDETDDDDCENDVAMRGRLETLRLQKELLGECHPDIALTLNNIGNIHYGRGEYGEAMKAFNEALVVSRGGAPNATQRSTYPRELQRHLASSAVPDARERSTFGIETVF